MLKTSDGKYFEYEIIGEFHTDNSWIHPTRSISSYELIFVIDGCVYITEDNIQYEINQNECIFLEPGKIHGGYKMSKPSFYWLHFYTNYPIPCKIYKGNEYYDIKYLMKKLLHISKTLSYDKSAVDSAAFLIFNELVSLKAIANSNSLANKMAEYIRINRKNNISVKNVADYFGYNSDYITKLFKKNFGIGVKEYINIEMLKYAKDMILTTNLSIKEISAKMNFADENLFIKFFIYHEDISPSKFRNKYFNTHMNNE